MLRAMRTQLCLACFLLFLLAFAPAVRARVTRVEVTSRTDILNGQRFGDVGSYERITGRIYYSLRAANWHNTGIVDLANAVNLKNGEVEFSSDFILVRPKDMAKGNGSMLLEIPNRGHSRILSIVDGGDWDLAHSAGDAWLLRNGYTIAAVGWQWDAEGPGALRFFAPIAKDHGKTITGLLRGDFMLSKAADEVPLGHLILGNIGGSEYPVSNVDDPRNVLTVCNSRTDTRTVIPRSQWRFAHSVAGKLTPSDRFLHLDGGFQPGRIYEYVYAVADPVVAGGGFAAIRDFASWSKYVPDALAPVKRVYGEGISQNGRFLRDYLYEAFNGDEEGRMALDGVLAHVAGAGRGSFNYRFAQPSRDAQPTSSVFYPTDIFPFTDSPETDPANVYKKEKPVGLLDRETNERAVPKIFFSNTSYEYWGRAAALIHTQPDVVHKTGVVHASINGMIDAPLSPNVRVYHFTGLQHFSGPWPPRKGTGDLLGQQPQSPLPMQYFWRAMIANMDVWVRNGTEPPPSSYPRIADHNLVPLAQYAFPKIPGVALPHEANEAFHLNFGRDWRKTGILSLEPPIVGQPFPVLVPQVDSDGNERDGIRLPEYGAPLATYAPWNLRDPSIGAPDQRVSFEGSWIPFAKSAAERQRSGDPRPSIEERYKSRDEYMQKYTAALDELIQQRWILPEDRAPVLERGREEWELATQ